MMIAASVTGFSSFPFFSSFEFKTLLNPFNNGTSSRKFRRVLVIRSSTRDRSKNRKPLQRGRNLSTEAIQIVQALKRASNKNDTQLVQQLFQSKVSRLLKLDLMAVLRELIRQNQPLLALQVFEDVRKEYWYKPQLLIYVEMIKMFASNDLFEKVELLLFYLKIEKYHLVFSLEDFNDLFRVLIDFGFITHVMECFQLMKEVQCDPNESTFRILVIGLESKGESGLSCMLRQEAEEYFGWPLEYLEEEEETNVSCN